jgi:hypothetical protein
LPLDRNASLLAGLVAGVTGGLIVGLAVSWVSALAGTMAGLMGGLTAGLAVAMAGAWAHFATTRIWLALTRRLPWNLLAFLDDAYDRGVLRRFGVVYQFRHDSLRDQVAAGTFLAGTNDTLAGVRDGELRPSA